MPRKLFIILIVSLAILVFSNLAWATVLGTWTMQGTQSVTVRIPGSPAGAAKSNFNDTFTFEAGGHFKMSYWHKPGAVVNDTWTQVKKNFTVNLDSHAVADYWSWVLNALQYNVSVTPKKFTFTGTEQKDGTIKGKISISMDLYFNDLKKKGSASISATCMGTKAAGDELLLTEEDDLLPGSELLIDIIEEMLQGAIPSEDGTAP